MNFKWPTILELELANGTSMSLDCQVDLYITNLGQSSLIILGPPAAPLEITDITKHQAILHWKPPLDDGGSRILHYCVEKRDTANEEWTPVATYNREIFMLVQGLFEGEIISSESSKLCSNFGNFRSWIRIPSVSGQWKRPRTTFEWWSSDSGRSALW